MTDDTCTSRAELNRKISVSVYFTLYQILVHAEFKCKISILVLFILHKSSVIAHTRHVN